ncbi:Protein Njmu-R1 [Lamellibrachia satsuma]|nr:Protein Njmu-R1 [Lamellibrachia satsuma]
MRETWVTLIDNRIHVILRSATEATGPETLESESASYSISTDDLTTHFCLSVVCTNLSPEREMQLKNTVARKLGKGSLFYSKGSINTIEFSGEGDSDDCHASYYHCLLKQDRFKVADKSSSEVKGQEDSLQFLVCFIHTAELHLFKAELDKYSINLLSYLDSKIPLTEQLQSYLQCWYTASTKYFTSCVIALEHNLKYLIYVALLDAELKVVCSNDQLKADIISFLDCCSLSELLSNLAIDRKSDSSTSLLDADPDAVKTSSDMAGMPKTETPTVVLHLDGATCQFSSHECNQFCEEWSNALMTGNAEDPVFIRQVIENYRLKAIQDMNTLKRHLRQAETDYYSLFRCAIFLGQCGNSTVLLRHAVLESDGSDHGVLRVLHCHLEAGSSKST